MEFKKLLHMPENLSKIHAEMRKTLKFQKASRRYKQEAHGLHRSPEKPVQINEYIWANQSNGHIFYKTGPVVQEEEIFKFRENTFAILL